MPVAPTANISPQITAGTTTAPMKKAGVRAVTLYSRTAAA